MTNLNSLDFAGAQPETRSVDASSVDHLSSPRDVAHYAMTTLLDDRRGATQTCPSSGVCEACIQPHVDRLTDSIEAGEPMKLMLLAFPCKSPSPEKVLGAEPDMAEMISLRHIDGWAKRISAFYEPGAKVVIGADGRAFADLVGVSDQTVSTYIKGVKGLIEGMGLFIDYIGIDDLLPDLSIGEDYDGMREALADNAVPVESLKNRAQEDPDFAYQINGIERFLTDDLIYVISGKSRTQIKKYARQRAYEIVRRGDVLRDELEKKFPHAARLSVHPQTNHGRKLGVHVTPSREDWVTPWHAAAIQHEDGSFRLIKRREAEKAGAALAHFGDGRPSHFIAAPSS